MKRSILTLSIILFSVTLSLAQNIPNGGFEEWATGEDNGWEPVNWQTMNGDDFTNVWQVEGRTGESAALMKVEWDEVFQQYMTCMIFYKGYFPIDQRYTQFSCYYKGSSIEGDSLQLNVSVWKNEQMIGYGFGGTNQSADNWTEVAVSINYANGETPDAAFVAMNIPPSEGVHYGTEFYVDDLSLKMGGTGIFEHQTDDPYRFSLYPNPASEQVHLTFELNSEHLISIDVVDVNNKVVRTLVNEAIFSSGRHRIETPLNKLQPGFYFCRITDEKGCMTLKKLVIL
jgi:hypothetical protein